MSANARAGLYIVLACFFFSGMNALAKLALAPGSLGGLHPLQVTFARYLFAAMLLVPFAPKPLTLPTGGRFGRYALRVGSGYLGVLLMFVAIQELRLGDATAIAFSSPLFAVAAAVLLLGETAARRRWTAAAVGFVGVLVITQPTQEAFQPMALVALLAAVAMGVEIAGVKWVSDIDRPATVIILSNSLAVPLAGAAAIAVWAWPSWQQWLLLAGIGAVAVLGQQCVLRAMRLGEANFIAPFFYFTLVFAIVFGAVMFEEIPPLTTFAGAAIIVACGLYAGRGQSQAADRLRPPLSGGS